MFFFADFAAVREFVQKINSQRDESEHIRPGEVNALGLLDEIFHFIIRKYEERENPNAIKNALANLQSDLGEDKVYKLLFDFTSKFPPLEVHQGKSTVLDYLNGYAGEKSNMELALEELMLLYFDNLNPAGKKLKELFDDNYLEHKEEYNASINGLENFFKEQPKLGYGGKDLFSFLKEPILSNPDSLEDQLEFIKNKWGLQLEAEIIRRILSGQDLSKEDVKLFESADFGGGGAPTIVPVYKGVPTEAGKFILGKSMYKYAEEIEEDYEEPERFTPDLDWMPNVVLIAKNTYVWLYQLSQKYKREITRLDQIPDEELDYLAESNFTGLWLIGLWERSPASRKIKHLLGNIDAVASAYSLYDYHVAQDLGGDYAYENLNKRAAERGIRLASDMVPNHTGIYSDWVINHPDYFIQNSKPPFPNYSFAGTDLADDPNIEIRIEDGYWNKSDAAVVFERRDKRTGKIAYIYHGNDGTNMPWNDTAQLDLLKKEVREAVIEKIMEVARKFSIIRFDAAMTLTKRHFSRLWYPQPGKGGDIPSRSDHAMSKAQFDALFPEEFWREVVGRINDELPDTLLLAEAFWLMEGYFVRSLGMHRVYNSAFMNMLMNEENDKYRDLITNTLEFEPEILKRYVNFMSNPDEETAVHQFGAGDKYFGVATLMVTLPGLPMFAHGQVEGFSEKYGMEYKRAYYNETPNGYLIDRHGSEIFPLMRMRFLFSQVRNFWFYDFFENPGKINENVFAYSNFEKGERAIIFYNNRYERSAGSVRFTTPKLIDAETGETERKLLGEAIGLQGGGKLFYVFKEFKSKTERLKPANEFFEKGFSVSLEGFESKVFLDFREIFDEENHYAKLYEELGDAGVPSVSVAVEEIRLRPVHETFTELLEPAFVKKALRYSVKLEKNLTKKDYSTIAKKFDTLLTEINKAFKTNVESKTGEPSVEKKLASIRSLNAYLDGFEEEKKTPEIISASKTFKLSKQNNYREYILVYFNLLIMMKLKTLFAGGKNINEKNFDENLLLDIPIRRTLSRLGKTEDGIINQLTLIRTLALYYDQFVKIAEKPINAEDSEEKLLKLFTELLNDEFVKLYLGVNLYNDVWYFSKENYEDLVDWIITLLMIESSEKKEKAKPKMPAKRGRKKKSAEPESESKRKKPAVEIAATVKLRKDLIELASRSGYDYDSLLELIKHKNKT
ncbi:MAG: alpha-amylase [Chlorobi bacterium]|nr:alpha-amylase [Chlorobiota bacterium]